MDAAATALSAATQILISEALTALAATSAPSRTRWGARVSSTWSFELAGSPSIALTTTTGRRLERDIVSHLRDVGNAAPPRPKRPDAAISSKNRDRDAWSVSPASDSGPWIARWSPSVVWAPSAVSSRPVRVAVRVVISASFQVVCGERRGASGPMPGK